jgi:hypothetical protein
MRKLTFTLVALACAGLAAPAVATDSTSSGRSSLQFANAEMVGKVQASHEFSAAEKKKKKKAATSRKSWGG